MKQGKIANAVFTVSALALAGCMVGPDYVEPSFKIAEEELMKEHFSRDEGLWKTALPADSLPKGDWWKVFNDKTLDSLLKQCRENSPDLKAAFWRVEQARETALMDQSDLYPQLNGNASYSRTGTSRNARGYSGTYDNWAAGFGITWDLDLFGRIRSIIESDVAEAQASLDEYENLMLLMQAQVATLYFTIRQYSSEIELLERTVKVRKDQTQYVARRLKYGEANDVDMQRALQEEYDASAQLASVERQMAITISQYWWGPFRRSSTLSRLRFRKRFRSCRPQYRQNCWSAGRTSPRPNAKSMPPTRESAQLMRRTSRRYRFRQTRAFPLKRLTSS